MNRRQAMKSLAAAVAAPPFLQPENADIHAHIEQSFDAHLEAVQNFIRQKSISSENVGVRECAEYLADILRRLGASAELAETDGFPVVWGFYDAGAPRTLAVYSLYDVVHVVESEWSSPPFEARVVPLAGLGKAIVGRGAVNQKGPIRALLNAMESVVAVRGKLPLNVMFVFEGEEELGSPHLPQFVARYADRLRTADGCLSPGAGQNLQGSVVLELGNKGIVYFEMEASGERMPHGPRKFDLSSYQQTVVESPVWRLVEALATLTDGNGPKLRIEELNRAVAPLTAQDRDLIRKLTGTFNPDEVWKRQFQVDSFTEGLEGEALLERYVFSPSLNIDGIWAGYTGEGVATLMPQKATAKLDFRLVPNLRASEVMPAIRRHLDERGFGDIALRELSGYDWSRTPLEAPIVETLLASYRGYGFEPQIWPLRPSGAPAYLFTGPPVSIPMIGGGLGHGARQHSVDEYLVIEGEGRIAGLPQGEKFYADFLFAFARG